MISTEERRKVIVEKVLFLSSLDFDLEFIEDDLMSFVGRCFKLSIIVTEQEVAFEAYLWLSGPANDALLEEIKTINEQKSFFRDGKRWMKFGITEKPEHLAIIAVIPAAREKEETIHHAFFYYDQEFQKIFAAIANCKELIKKA